MQTDSENNNGADELVDSIAKNTSILVHQIQRLVRALNDANEVCRSAMAIAERDGNETNWTAFRCRCRSSLALQHAVMYPPNYQPSAK